MEQAQMSSGFARAVELGLSSETFATATANAKDKRDGFDDESERVVVECMKQGMTFDEARLELFHRQLRRAGIDPETGLPMERGRQDAVAPSPAQAEGDSMPAAVESALAAESLRSPTPPRPLLLFEDEHASAVEPADPAARRGPQLLEAMGFGAFAQGAAAEPSAHAIDPGQSPPDPLEPSQRGAAGGSTASGPGGALLELFGGALSAGVSSPRVADHIVVSASPVLPTPAGARELRLDARPLDASFEAVLAGVLSPSALSPTPQRPASGRGVSPADPFSGLI